MKKAKFMFTDKRFYHFYSLKEIVQLGRQRAWPQECIQSGQLKLASKRSGIGDRTAKAVET